MSPDMVKWQLSLSKSVQGIVTDKSWECRLSITISVWLLLYENLDVSVDELDGQVCFLDKAVDGPDVKSNIAQRYCAVHRKLNVIQGQK